MTEGEPPDVPDVVMGLTRWQMASVVLLECASLGVLIGSVVWWWYR